MNARDIVKKAYKYEYLCPVLVNFMRHGGVLAFNSLLSGHSETWCRLAYFSLNFSVKWSAYVCVFHTSETSCRIAL